MQPDGIVLANILQPGQIVHMPDHWRAYKFTIKSNLIK